MIEEELDFSAWGFEGFPHSIIYPGQKEAQRKRVYDAEHELVYQSRRFESVEQMQVYTDLLVGDPWFDPMARFRPRRITVTDGRRRRSACASWDHRGYLVKMPKRLRCEEILLHEIAHCISREMPYHGPQWVWVYLQLIEHQIGKDRAACFKEVFRRYNVHWTRPSWAS